MAFADFHLGLFFAIYAQGIEIAVGEHYFSGGDTPRFVLQTDFTPCRAGAYGKVAVDHPFAGGLALLY